MSFGVQTFTVRKKQKKDMERAYLSLLEMGVTELEVARIDFTEGNARRIKSLSDEHEIRPVSIQVKPKYIINHPDEIIKF